MAPTVSFQPNQAQLLFFLPHFLNNAQCRPNFTLFQWSFLCRWLPAAAELPSLPSLAITGHQNHPSGPQASPQPSSASPRLFVAINSDQTSSRRTSRCTSRSFPYLSLQTKPFTTLPAAHPCVPPIRNSSTAIKPLPSPLPSLHLDKWTLPPPIALSLRPSDPSCMDRLT